MENELLRRYARPFFTRDQIDALMDYFGLEDYDLLEPFLDKEIMEENDYALGLSEAGTKKSDDHKWKNVHDETTSTN